MWDTPSTVGGGKSLSWASHQSSQLGLTLAQEQDQTWALDPCLWEHPTPPCMKGHTHLLTGFLMPWPSEPSPSPSFQPIFISIW